MVLSLFLPLLLLAPSTLAQISTASSDGGYTGYSLGLTGDPSSTLYSTDSTNPNASAYPPPDVYLNATVQVGEIDLTVLNLTAKINLAADVLSLLHFNAGVDLSIDKVALRIANVSAKVLLEARLENLVLMIDDVLNSLDLNPVLATLGQDVGSLANSTVAGLTGSGKPLAARNYDLANNILYSVNDYSGNTHTNRVLAQSGDIVDEFLDNDGRMHGQRVVGSYAADMAFNGYNASAVRNGQAVRELEYVYTPFAGLSVVSAVFVDAGDTVVATQVLSESSAGGSSTVGDL